MADDTLVMDPEAFRAWRQSLGWKQKEAAEKLGLKKRMIQYYEKGDRNGKSVEIPKSVRLACYALVTGVADYDGKRATFGKRHPKKKTEFKENGRGGSADTSNLD